MARRSGDLLSRKEFDLLHALIARAGDIVTRDELMRDVWHTIVLDRRPRRSTSTWAGCAASSATTPRARTLITTIRGQGLRFETGGPAPRRTTGTAPG